MILELEIPGLPRTPNRLRSWRTIRANAQRWRLNVWEALLENRGNLPADAPTLFPLKLAHLTLTRYSSRQPDHDGLVASFKPVIDGLIWNAERNKLGILVDDSPQVIGRPDYHWEQVAAGAGKIRVVVKG